MNRSHSLFLVIVVLIGVVAVWIGLNSGSRVAADSAFHRKQPVLSTEKAAKSSDIESGNDGAFSKVIRPFLQKHCFSCHGPKKQSADRRFDKLTEDLGNEKDIDLWQDILDQLNRGSMPPKLRPRPKFAEISDVVSWVTKRLQKGNKSKNQHGPVLRRLNRRDYNNTIRDLLKIDISYNPSRSFPRVSSDHGFDTIGSVQLLSPALLREALAAAKEAIDRTVRFGPMPKEQTHKILPKIAAAPVYRNAEFVKIVTGAEDGFQRFYPTQKRFVVLEQGEYIIRVHAVGLNSAFRGVGQIKGPIKMSVRVGPPGKGNAAGSRRKVRVFDIPDSKPHIYEARAQFNRGDVPIISFPNGYPGSFKNLVRKRYGKEARKNRKPIMEKYDGPQLRISWIEVEGPICETWPPAGHVAIFGENPAGQNLAAAEAALLQFTKRAFRRPTTKRDVEPFLKLFKLLRKRGRTFDVAIRSSLQAVLCTPSFLFLSEQSKELDDFGLASRLSYFLWSSMPDEELFHLAAQGKLHPPAILRQQVVRMLSDHRSVEFAKSFAGHWLGTARLGEMLPDPKRFKQYYKGNLQAAMREETRRFFAHVLLKNLSPQLFIDADFTFLNERLAEHYGIAGVKGSRFQLVQLKPEYQRGGVLGQASVLTVTSNGSVTSPVVRGVWILENLLGTPPSPPPPDIEPLEPDTRGATTIRERLFKHRSVKTCASCHNKIDPLGFALEHYDPIGGWRPKYDNKRQIDATGNLPDGQRFDGAAELKKLLLKNKGNFVRCLTEKLLLCSTGRALTLKDRYERDKIAAAALRNNYGLRDLVIAVVQSDAFVKQ